MPADRLTNEAQGRRRTTAAIVLAAGRSQRMGTQKLLLPWAGQTIIGHVVDQLLVAGLKHVVVVVCGDAAAIGTALAGRAVRFVQNPDPQSEMLGSIRCGLRALPDDIEAVLIALGDQPSITSVLVHQLIEVYQHCGRGIVLPECRGKRGHPTILSSRYFTEVLSQYDGTGLRGLMDIHSADVFEVVTENQAILEDLDTPADYERALRANLSEQS